jgi:hypothetical protein
MFGLRVRALRSSPVVLSTTRMLRSGTVDLGLDRVVGGLESVGGFNPGEPLEVTKIIAARTVAAPIEANRIRFRLFIVDPCGLGRTMTKAGEGSLGSFSSGD